MVPEVVDRYGEPFADSSAIPSLYLAQLARRHVTVALNGDGGDESFGGYSRYAANLFAERLARFPSPLRRAVGAAGRHLPPSGRIDSTLSRARRVALTLPLQPGARYFAYSSDLDRLPRDELYSDEMREQVGESVAADFVTRAFDESSGDALLDRMLETDVRTYLPGDLLVKLDRASMLHNLEVRSPFMDHELVQFAAALTTDQLLKGGPKRMLREAFAYDLPAWVFKRKKMGFAVPIGEWFRTDPPLKAMLHDNLFASDSFGATLPLLRADRGACS